MTQTTPVWKIAATSGGTALTGAAVWLNATHIAHTDWGSPLVAAGIIVTLCAAVTPPFALLRQVCDNPSINWRAQIPWLVALILIVS